MSKLSSRCSNKQMASKSMHGVRLWSQPIFSDYAWPHTKDGVTLGLPREGGEDPDPFFGEPGMMLHFLPKGCHIALLATQEAFLESMWVVLVDHGKDHMGQQDVDHEGKLLLLCLQHQSDIMPALGKSSCLNCLQKISVAVVGASPPRSNSCQFMNFWCCQSILESCRGYLLHKWGTHFAPTPLLHQ